MKAHYLSQISDNELLNETRTLVTEERRITLELIEHLREIDRRMTFAQMGYSSLFEFCVKHLGLSEGSAHRRISTMRLFRDLPEAKQSLLSGNLSLSNAAKLQSAFRARKKLTVDLNPAEKKEILQQISGLTQRECESKLFQLIPETMKSLSEERERKVGPHSTEIRLVIDDEFYSKLQRLKELMPHRSPNGGYKEILEYLVEKEIERVEKTKGLRTSSETGANPASEVTAPAGQTETTQSDIKESAQSHKKISPSIKKEVWRRANGKCEYPNCASRFDLEIDHKLPRALGGGNNLTNLQLLCRTHNVSAAKQVLGAGIMSRYIPQLK